MESNGLCQKVPKQRRPVMLPGGGLDYYSWCYLSGIKNLKLAGSIINPFGCNPPVNLRDGATLRPHLLKLGAEHF